MPYKGIKPCAKCRHSEWVATGGTSKRVVLDCKNCGESIISSSAQANRLYHRMEEKLRLDALNAQVFESIGLGLAFHGRKTCDPARITDDAVHCAQWTTLFDTMGALIRWDMIQGWNVTVLGVIDVSASALSEAICKAIVAAKTLERKKLG